MADSSNPGYRQMEAELDSGFAAVAGAGGADPAVLGLCLAAAAAAAGRRLALRAALRLLLRRGADPGTLREALLQTYLFAGYPRAINALAELAALGPPPALPPVVDLARDLGRDREWSARGQALCRRVYGGGYDKLLRTMARISPELGRWMVTEGYGKVLSRPALDAPTRELAAVAALMTLDVPDQLRAHARGALRVGAAPEGVAAALRTAALVTPEALPFALEILEEAVARREGGAA